MRRASQRFLGGLALLAMATPLGAQELTGRFLWTAQQQEVDEDATVTTFKQSYLIQFRMPVSSLFQYSVRLRYDGDDRTSEIADISADSGRSLLEPTVELSWRTRVWDVSTGFRYTETEDTLESVSREIGRSDWYTRFNWRPYRLPTFSLLYDRIGITATDTDRNQDESRLLADLTYFTGPFRVLYNFEDIEVDLTSLEVERDRRRHTVNFNYQDRFVQDRLQLTTGLLLQNNDATQRSETPVEVDEEVPTIAGLFAVDTSPIMGPLTPEPGLIDGDLLTPTSVDLGGAASGGGTDRNIGLDFDVERQSDRVEIWVNQRLTPLSAVRFNWVLYVSDNNLDWFLADPSVSFTFDSVFDRFELDFPPVTSRYIKVVNTTNDPALASVFVTEAIAKTSQILVGEEKRESRIRNANLTVAFSPTPKWNIASTTFVGRDDTEFSLDPDITVEERLDETLSSVWQPIRKMSLTGIARWRLRNRTNGFDEDNKTFTLGIGSSPYQNLDLALSYQARRDKQDSRSFLDADTIDLRAASQLLRHLNVSVDLGYVETVRVPIDQTTQTRSTRFMLYTDPRPEITFASDLTLDHDRVTGPDIIGELLVDRRIWANRLVWRPNTMFSLIAELRDESFAGVSGLSKFLSVDWIPLSGGKLHWTIAFLTDSKTAVDQQQDQFRTFLRWYIKRQVFLDVNYLRVDSTNFFGERSIETFTTSLEIRF